MYGGREKLHILLQWEKTCICCLGRANQLKEKMRHVWTMVDYTSSFSWRKLVSVASCFVDRNQKLMYESLMDSETWVLEGFCFAILG